MADPNLDIKVRIVNETRGALKGVTRDLKRAEDQARKESDKTAKHSRQNERRKRQEITRTLSKHKQAQRDAALEGKRRAREILEDFRKAERRKRDELKKTLRETQMSERARARLIARTEREITRARNRSVREAQGQRRGTAGRFAGRAAAAAGAVGAVGGAAFNTATRLAGAGGVRSREENLQLGNEFNARLADLSNKSGINAETLRARINQVAATTVTDQFELLDALQATQGRFGAGAVGGLVDNLESVARAARGAGGSVQALASATGTAATIFGLSTEEADAFTAQLVAIGNEGAIEAENMAQTFAPFLGVFQRSTGQTGAAGAQNAAQFAALAGTAFGEDAAARTQAEAVLRQLGRRDVQERIALASGGRARGRGANRRIEGGVRIAADGSLGGQVTDPLEAIRALSAQGLNPGQLQQILGDSNAVQGFGVLATALQSEQGQAIMGASAAAGRASIEGGIRSQMTTNATGMELERARIEAFSTAQANMDEYARAVISATRTMGNFEAAHPAAIESLITLKDAAVGLAGVFAVLKVSGLASAAGGLGGGIAAAGGLGASTAAAGAGTTAGVAVGGLAAGLGIGRGIGHLVDAVTGGENGSLVQDQNDALSSLMSGTLGSQLMDGLRFITGNERVTQAQPSDRANEDNTRATAENTRATTEAAREMRNAARAIGNAARSVDTGGAPPAGVE